MKIDIKALNKAEILAALYNNALKSRRVDSWIASMPFISRNSLSEKEAESILKTKKFIDRIGIVEFNIDFSGNEIETGHYDNCHHDNCHQGAKSAEVVIKKFKLQLNHDAMKAL
ncbi:MULTISPECIES: hypothetical protein [unclassified Legionella]|uniref:hypothetical protein n=1 Tax=unclassified Legionella TaxID=2622702 RepID=UPI0010550785|nr:MULTISPECIES: hypothetical protein [unclassified Legionella]MDI9817544.1 hypothetical protein [Legionella sp. PL877]